MSARQTLLAGHVRGDCPTSEAESSRVAFGSAVSRFVAGELWPGPGPLMVRRFTITSKRTGSRADSESGRSRSRSHPLGCPSIQPTDRGHRPEPIGCGCRTSTISTQLKLQLQGCRQPVVHSNTPPQSQPARQLMLLSRSLESRINHKAEPGSR